MINYEKAAEKIFRALKGHGYKVVGFQSTGERTVDPEAMRLFYVVDPNIMVNLDDDLEEVKFNKSKNEKLSNIESAKKAVENIAREFLLDFTIRNYGKNIKPKDFSYQAKKRQEVSEARFGKMHGRKKVSYQPLQEIRVKVKHKKKVDDEKRGSRSRNIESIFLERGEERFKFPENNLNAARAAARHMENKGSLHDDIGKKIIEAARIQRRLREFNHYLRKNKLIDESNHEYVDYIKETIKEIRSDFQSLQKPTKYETFKEEFAGKENYTKELNENPERIEASFGTDKLQDEFFDVMPIVNNIITTKEAWKKDIEDASEEELYIDEEELDTSAYMFESKRHEKAYKLEVISEHITNKNLQKLLEDLTYKIKNNIEPDEFEINTIKKVFSNINR